MCSGIHSSGLICFTYRSMKESRLNCTIAVMTESFIYRPSQDHTIGMDGHTSSPRPRVFGELSALGPDT
jgi:hypothetical protein